MDISYRSDIDIGSSPILISDIAILDVPETSTILMRY